MDFRPENIVSSVQEKIARTKEHFSDKDAWDAYLKPMVDRILSQKPDLFLGAFFRICANLLIEPSLQLYGLGGWPGDMSSASILLSDYGIGFRNAESQPALDWLSSFREELMAGKLTLVQRITMAAAIFKALDENPGLGL
jgi:hypothetical protein